MTHQQILAEMLERISGRASNQLACSKNFPSQYWLSTPGKGHKKQRAGTSICFLKVVLLLLIEAMHLLQFKQGTTCSN